MSSLRNIFIAGLLLLVPIVITVWILRFVLGVLDDFSQPLLQIYLGRHVPYAGAILTALIILFLGALSNVIIGKRIVAFFERQISRIPGVRSVYSTTRQVIRGFTSTEGMNFQRTVLIRRNDGSMMMGFVTREFEVVEDDQPTPVIAVYVPTNHLYLGDVLILPRDRVLEVDLSLEAGLSAVLSCGGSVPGEVAAAAADRIAAGQSVAPAPAGGAEA